MARKAWCNDHVEEICENCDLSIRTQQELRQAVNFKKENATCSVLSNRAVMPLASIKDPKKQKEAIEAVKTAMDATKKPEAGEFEVKPLTAKQVKRIVDEIVPPMPKKINRSKESLPMIENFNGPGSP